LATTSEATPEISGKWWSSITQEGWKVLVGSNLGWLFDGYETYTLVLTVVVVMQTLLPRSELPRLSFFQGLAVSATLFGWALGGTLWGIVTDYIGRKRALMGSIIVYAVFTGLTALTQTWWQFALIRLLTGLGLGAEWGTGATLLSEKWHVNARAKGAAMLQAGFGVGFLLASVIWLMIEPLGMQAWRFMYVIGAIPALLSVLYIARQVPESSRWEDTNRARHAAFVKRQKGEPLTEPEKLLVKPTIVDVFSNPRIRRLTLAAIGVCFATTVGWWAVSSWIPAFVELNARGLNAAHWAAVAGIVYNVAAIIAYIAFGFLADWVGRRLTTSAFMLAACLATWAVFLLPVSLNVRLSLVFVNGLFTMGQWSLYPILLPELYPTRIRASAAALVFNVVRFIACIGPFVAGYLIVQFHGIAHIASMIALVYLVGAGLIWFLPETKGRPLPE
jgi:MFS family permease